MTGPDRSLFEIGLDKFREAIHELSGPIALDLETSSLTPFIAQVTWLSWATDSRTGVVPIFHRNPGIHNCAENEIAKTLKELLSNPFVTTIWHNATFDLSILVARKWICIDEVRCKLFDTMLASYILNPVKVNEGGRHSLKWLYREYLQPITNVKQPTFKETAKGQEFADVDFDDAAFYAGFDAWSTMRLYEIFSKYLLECPDLNRYFHSVEMPHVLTTIEITTTGLHLIPQESLPKSIPIGNGQSIEIKDISSLLQEQDRALQKVFRLSGRTFKFSSPGALRNTLFYDKRLAPLGRGKKSRKYLIDKYTLTRVYAEQERRHPKRLIAFILYGKLLQEVTKKHAEFYSGTNRITGKIHPLVRQTTSSGRYSCKSPNTLSMSSVSNIKHHIVPGEGKSFVVADFSQIDLRVIANETGAQDPKSKMLEAVNRGYDLHTMTLGIVNRNVATRKVKKFNKDHYECDGLPPVYFQGNPSEESFVKQAKRERAAIAKPLNFGISYGLGPKGLLANLNGSEKFQELISQLPNAQNDLAWIKQLDEQTEDAKKNKRTSAEAEVFLKKFHAAYPEIPDFQSEVEAQGLQVSGATFNIFGRRCRAEGIQFLLKRNAVIDVLSPHGEWFRVTCRGLRFTKDGYDAFVKKVESIQVGKDINAREVSKSDPLYQVELKKFNSVTKKMLTGIVDEHEWRARVFKIHFSGLWGGENFFEAFKPASPTSHPDLAQLSSHPCHPFVRFTHSQIKFIQSGPLATFMRYPGYDALRRKLISYRVSSTSMDICKIAMIEFRIAARRWLRRGRLKSMPRIVNCVHDEIAVECDSGDAKLVKWLLNERMSFKGFPHGKYLAQGRKLLVKIEAESNLSDINYALAKPA